MIRITDEFVESRRSYRRFAEWHARVKSLGGIVTAEQYRELERALHGGAPHPTGAPPAESAPPSSKLAERFDIESVSARRAVCRACEHFIDADVGRLGVQCRLRGVRVCEVQSLVSGDGCRAKKWASSDDLMSVCGKCKS